jgi:hypothetical protein
MVSDAVAKSVQYAEPTIDELPTSRCRSAWNADECIVEDRDPQRLLVPRADEVAPEPESEFGDDGIGLR